MEKITIKSVGPYSWVNKQNQPYISKWGKPYCRFEIVDSTGRKISMLGSEGSPSMKLTAGMTVDMDVKQNGNYLNGELPKSGGGPGLAKMEEWLTEFGGRLVELEKWREKHVKFHASQTVDPATVVPPIPKENLDVTDLPF